MSDNQEVKKTSKLSSLIGQAQENQNSSQFTVHYSENNWETTEEVNLILNDESTINELMETAIQKFKTELYYDNIDKKKYVVRIFKKKKKIPNLEYPVCNLDSKVGDFGKSHFCLVENEGEENDVQKDDINENIQINEEKEKQNKNDDVITKNVISLENKNKANQNNNSSDNSNNIGETKENKEKDNKPNCRSCFIF